VLGASSGELGIVSSHSGVLIAVASDLVSYEETRLGAGGQRTGSDTAV